MLPSPALECRGIRKSFGSIRVLSDVSFKLGKGTLLSVVGENGAGKSTLMNIIGGVLAPSGGEMLLGGAIYRPASPADASVAGIAFVHQELNLFPNLTIADNLALISPPLKSLFGISWVDRKQQIEDARRLLAEVGLDLDPTTKVELLSQGERQLMEIARALGSKAMVVIFDEPTTSLPGRDVERLFGIIDDLRRRGIAIIYISHALDDVLRIADQVIVLRDGAVAASGMRGQFSRGELITAMVGRSVEQLYPDKPLGSSRDVIFEAQHLSSPGVIHDVSFQLHCGEILGVSGLLGSGRTELLRILFGLDACPAGDILLKGDSILKTSTRERIVRGMAFVTESRREDGLYLDDSVASNLRSIFHTRLDVPGTVAELQIQSSNLDSLPVRYLSGGNQQKVAFGKWLASPPAVLLLDEPTRGIDVAARLELYRTVVRLAEAGTAVLMVSSEIEELVGMCHRVLVMRKGEVALETGDLDRETILGAAV